jgi:hypothetical protein
MLFPAEGVEVVFIYEFDRAVVEKDGKAGS